MDSMFDEEPKARCPDCSQSLTFVRTRSHEKRWYCYGCEKYVDNQNTSSQVKDNHARIEALSGLQVVDSHGILVGRVRKAIPFVFCGYGSLLDLHSFPTRRSRRSAPMP